MRAIVVTYYIYFCINPYVIFVFHILSLKMNADHYLRAPRLPRLPVIETFEDLPSLYHIFYYEPPIPYASPTPGIVVQDLRTLVGLPIHNLPLSIVNTSFPLDEILLVSTVQDWMRANANFATLVIFSQSKFDSMIFMPPTHMALMARRQALRRIFVILRNQALSEYNPN
jgi:hypothetical protein